jgi:hypothetical protein
LFFILDCKVIAVKIQSLTISNSEQGLSIVEAIPLVKRGSSNFREVTFMPGQLNKCNELQRQPIEGRHCECSDVAIQSFSSFSGSRRPLWGLVMATLGWLELFSNYMYSVALISMRFIFLFLLFTTSSWAMEDKSDEEMRTPFLRTINPLTNSEEDVHILINRDSLEEDDGSEPETNSRAWETDSEQEMQAPLLSKRDFSVIEMEQDSETKTFLQSNLSEQNDLLWDALPNELFLPILLKCMKVDPCSIRHLFLVSKVLNQRVGAFNMNIWIPSLILPLSPSVQEIIDVINDIRKYQRSLGPLTSDHIIKNLPEIPAYKVAIERLPKAKQFFTYSPSFWRKEGSKEIDTIEAFHKQRFPNLKPSTQPTPSRFKQFLSSMARDRWTFGAVTLTALPLAAICAWELYNLCYQYQTALNKNLQYTSTPEYINQYYIEGSGFPHHTSGCNRILYFEEKDYCFNITGYCHGEFSSSTNVPDIAQRVSLQILKATEPYFSTLKHIPLNNINALFSEFFDNICAGKQLSAYYRNRNFQAIEQTVFIERLGPNSPLLLTNWMGHDKGWSHSCQHAGFGPNLAKLSTDLYYCNPIAVAKGMTQTAVPSILKAITLYSVGLVVSVGSWIVLKVEKCFNLYDDDA